jgi:TonB family protein
MSTLSFLAMSAPIAMAVTLPPAPPIQLVTSISARTLITWAPGQVQCAGNTVVADRFERPLPSLIWNSPTDLVSITFVFEIEPSGRAIGIRNVGGDARSIGTEDVAPSLAATRFAPGRGYSDCKISYSPSLASLSKAPIADLITYSVNPISGSLPKEGWQRIHADGHCNGSAGLALRNRAFPDFQSMTATPGVRDWSLVKFDVDKGGVPMNATTVAGTGNAGLDLASRKAVEDSRYYGGGVSGCRYPYWRKAGIVPAPPAPDTKDFRPKGATCPDRREWAVNPVLRFPTQYSHRAIEGWAIVTYDVAPWGQIANIQVPISQPTEDFGKQAMSMLRVARFAANQGFVGCVAKVKFVMKSRSNGDLEP